VRAELERSLEKVRQGRLLVHSPEEGIDTTGEVGWRCEREELEVNRKERCCFGEKRRTGERDGRVVGFESVGHHRLMLCVSSVLVAGQKKGTLACEDRKR
jgi:hypothetical protein